MAFAFILWRLMHLQWIKNIYFCHLSEKNHRISTPILPHRGDILDRNGKKLAHNIHRFRAVFFGDSLGDLRQALKNFTLYIPLTSQDIEGILKKFRTRSPLTPIYLKENLSWSQVSVLETSLSLQGVNIEPDHRRTYPLGEAFALMGGYLGPAKNTTTEGKEGYTGLERIYNTTLTGRTGHCVLEVNARRKILHKRILHAPQRGQKLITSIHAPLQHALYKALLPYKAGAGVLIDLTRGEILACASCPGFDPHVFLDSMPEHIWSQMANNPLKPLINRPLGGLYPPASLIKMAVILTALEQNIITPHTVVTCEGHYHLHGHTFHCWKKSGHGPVQGHQALAMSCDVFFYTLAKKISPTRFQTLCHRLGLGVRHLPQWAEDTLGTIPSPQWVRQTYHRPWRTSDMLMNVIGQGAMLVTPVHLAVMMARIATGTHITPTLLKQNTPQTFPSLDLNPTHLSYVQHALHAVTSAPYGTAFRAFHGEKNMAGKTGTGQVCRITKAERDQGLTKGDHRAWHTRDHGLFCGYAPFDRPRIALSLILEHSGSGSRTSAPLAHTFMTQALDLI